MTKLDIYGGLLGTGKTTLIKQMLSGAYAGYRTAIIENEVGKVNLDAEELQAASVSVRELSSGCICCTVKGRFTEAVDLLVQQENPDYIVVEPSGVADLEDVIRACVQSESVTLNRVIMVVNAKRIRKLLNIVGDFFLKQLKCAGIIYLNFTEGMTGEQIEEAKASIRCINPDGMLVSVPLAAVTGDTFPEGLQFNLFGADPQPARKSAKDSVMARIRGKEKSALTDWVYPLQGTFDETRVQKLLDIFHREESADVWRVKGYLKTPDGGVRKIDYVFGDQFLEERDTFASDKTNMLMIIGKRLDTLWLQEQLEKI